MARAPDLDPALQRVPLAPVLAMVLDLDLAQRRALLALGPAMDLAIPVLTMDLAMDLAMDLLVLTAMDLAMDLAATTSVMAVTTLMTTMEINQLPNQLNLGGRLSHPAWLMVDVILWVECQ
jgi:hypothetical protein